jgi:hypothetical protein
MSDPTVPEEQKGQAGVATATPVPSAGATDKVVAGGASGDAKSGDASDAQAKLAEKQTEIDALVQKYEKDLSAQRSSLDSGAAQREKALNERLAKFQADYDALATKDMDDAQRAVYEGRKANERADAAEKRAMELEQSLEDQRAFNNMLNFARSKGIPDYALDFNNGIDGLSRSAWDALEAPGAKKPVVDQKKTKLPAAPDVLTDGAGGSAHKGTMDELIKAQAFPGEHPEATERRIFDMIARGALPPTILPVGN